MKKIAFTGLVIFFCLPAFSQKYKKIFFKGDSVFEFPFPYYTFSKYSANDWEEIGEEYFYDEYNFPQNHNGLFYLPVGFPEGKWVAYHGFLNDKSPKKRKPAILLNISNNELNGKVVIYSLKDKIIAEGSYLNGELDGKWSIYHNGKLRQVNSYKSGLLDGFCMVLNKNGDTILTRQFKEGLMHGVAKNFENTKLESVIHFINNRKEGEERTYYPETGLPESVSTYKNGIKVGKSYSYFLNGKLWEENEYMEYNDTLTSEVKHGYEVNYTLEGKIYNKTRFIYGKAIENDTLYDILGNIMRINIRESSNGNSIITRYYFHNFIPGKLTTIVKYTNDTIRETIEYNKTGGILRRNRMKIKGKFPGDFDAPEDSLIHYEFYVSYSHNGFINFLRYSDRKTRTYYIQNFDTKGRIISQWEFFPGEMYVESTFDKNRISEIKYQHYNTSGIYRVSQEDSVVYYKKGNPITGKKKIKYARNVCLEGNLINGRRNGTWTYKSGKYILWKSNYVNNVQEGPSEVYNPVYNVRFRLGRPKTWYYWFMIKLQNNPKRENYVESKSFYINGRKEGADSTFLGKGIVSGISKFKDGKLNGEVKYFDIKGRLTYKAEYADGALNGLEENLDTTGFRLSSLKYENGKPVGEYIQYHNNRVVEMKGKFENGRKTGSWKIFYFSGKLKIDLTIIKPADNSDTMFNLMNNSSWYLFKGERYEEGTGSIIRYYENGIKTYEGNFENSMRKGLWTFWDENGNIQKKIDYTQGIYVYIHSNGKPDSVAHQGRFTSYYPNGKKELEALVMGEESKYNCRKEMTDVFQHFFYLDYFTTDENQMVHNGNGYVQQKNSGGIVLNEGPVKNGVKDGKWYYRTEDGNLSEMGTYMEGIKEGKWLSGDLSGVSNLDNACYRYYNEELLKKLRETLSFIEEYYRNGELRKTAYHRNRLEPSWGVSF